MELLKIIFKSVNLEEIRTKQQTIIFFLKACKESKELTKSEHTCSEGIPMPPMPSRVVCRFEKHYLILFNFLHAG